LTGSVSWPIENHTLHRILSEIQVMMGNFGTGRVWYVVCLVDQNEVAFVSNLNFQLGQLAVKGLTLNYTVQAYQGETRHGSHL